MNQHTELLIRQRVEQCLSGSGIGSLYKEKCMNWSGSVGKEPYSEICAAALLDFGFVEKLKKLQVITRTTGYVTPGHDGQPTGTNRKEEDFAKALFRGKWFHCIGRVLDYQVPLKNKQDDKAGKIDLVSYCSDPATVFLIELKVKDGAKDTLLRAVLEIATYYQVLDRKKFCDDYNCAFQKEDIHFKKGQIKKALLIEVGSLSHLQIKTKQMGQELKELIRKLRITVFSVEPTGQSHSVQELTI